MQLYHVGITTIDVTPPVGVFLAGYAGRDIPSQDVYHPLRADCIVIDDGDEPLLLVSIEWLGFYDRAPEARQRICARTDLNPSHILLSGSHTHCGPVLRREMDIRRHGFIDEDYIDTTLDRLAEAAYQALNQRQPARLRVGIGWCGISSSRRRPDGEGGVAFKPSLDAPHDHRVSVLTVESPDGDLRHVLYSYACHPTSSGAISRIGGDYVAFAGDLLETTYPGVAASFFQGCAGDQKVDARDPVGDGYRKLDITEVQAKGEQLGQAVARVIDSGDLRPIAGALDVSQELVTLTTDTACEQELRVHLTAGGYGAEWARHHLGLIKAGEPAKRTFSFEVQTVRVGFSLAIVALAGEMSVEYALRFNAELGGAYRDVWTLGYANEMVGYVPVRRQIAEGGYEVIDNNRHLLYTGPFATETEERIAGAVKRALL
jgi:hypothetical protein